MILIEDNVLSAEECLKIIQEASPKLTTATTLGKQIDGYRIADSTWLVNESCGCTTDITKRLQEIVSSITCLPIENQELPQVIRYSVGGEYKPHHDFFHQGTDYIKEAIKFGGQRVYSCLFYLNEGYTGGETQFTKKNLKVTPRTGRIVLWSNLLDNGALDFDSEHAGLPVTEGEKWIAIVWVREESLKNNFLLEKYGTENSAYIDAKII